MVLGIATRITLTDPAATGLLLTKQQQLTRQSEELAGVRRQLSRTNTTIAFLRAQLQVNVSKPSVLLTTGRFQKKINSYKSIEKTLVKYKPIRTLYYII